MGRLFARHRLLILLAILVVAVVLASRGQRAANRSVLAPPTGVAATPADESADVWWARPTGTVSSFTVTTYEGGIPVASESVAPLFTAAVVQRLGNGADLHVFRPGRRRRRAQPAVRAVAGRHPGPAGSHLRR